MGSKCSSPWAKDLPGSSDVLSWDSSFFSAGFLPLSSSESVLFAKKYSVNWWKDNGVNNKNSFWYQQRLAKRYSGMNWKLYIDYSREGRMKKISSSQTRMQRPLIHTHWSKPTHSLCLHYGLVSIGHVFVCHEIFADGSVEISQRVLARFDPFILKQN